MSMTTFQSGGGIYKITVYPPPADGRRYPILVFVHGNAGLGGQFGAQIHAFAKRTAAEGYCTAVPQYYVDDEPHLMDAMPKDDVLADAIDALNVLPDVDVARMGLVGFSLGAATVMEYVAKRQPGAVSVLADFFGFLTPSIRSAASRFPPTVIFHNRHDRIVDAQHSRELDQLLGSVDHGLSEYDEQYLGVNHSFSPGGAADLDSQAKTISWCEKYLPPVGS